MTTPTREEKVKSIVTYVAHLVESKELKRAYDYVMGLLEGYRLNDYTIDAEDRAKVITMMENLLRMVRATQEELGTEADKGDLLRNLFISAEEPALIVVRKGTRPLPENVRKALENLAQAVDSYNDKEEEKILLIQIDRI